MSVIVKMPQLSTSVDEGIVLKWFFQTGDRVKKDEVIVEVETEKVTFQVESPGSGILSQIFVMEGETAKTGQDMAVIIEDDDKKENFVQETTISSQLEVKKSEKIEKREKVENASYHDDRINISPIAKKIAKEKEIDIFKVIGTGPGGRICKEDILYFEKKTTHKEATLSENIRLGQELPLTRMMQIIGNRLKNSYRDVPHVYFSCEIDCYEIICFRNYLLERVTKENEIRVSLIDIIIKAVGKAIEKFPLFNSTLEDKIIKIHKNINIGFAVAVEEGLFVPVIRNVNKMDIVPIAIRRKSILDKIQKKKITMDELSGGTFTISNLGHYNIDFFTSIINPPEAAILSVAKIKERPMVIKGELEIRPSVKLGLSVDHRIINGNMAAQFLEELETLLVNPKILV